MELTQLCRSRKMSFGPREPRMRERATERFGDPSSGRREREAVVRGGRESEDANGQMCRVGGCKRFGEGEDIARYWLPKQGMMVWGVRFPNPAGRGKLAME